MIVLPRSQLKRFKKAGQRFAKRVGGTGKNLQLTADDYATLQTHRVPPPTEWIGTNEVKIRRCGLAKRFTAEAIQLFHLDTLANGTADKNPFTVRRATWDAAQQFKI